MILATAAALILLGGPSQRARCAAPADWHPPRVCRDAAGWAHFFEVWDAAAGRYEHQVLVGCSNLWIGEPLPVLASRLSRLSAAGGSFLRLWMRPSDGYYAYHYDPARRQVDLDTFNPAFFARLDTILGLAEARNVVVEVMLWDRCSGWVGGGLPAPTGWGDAHNPKNVFHPDNHFRSSAGDKPIPGLFTGDQDRLWNAQWYNTTNRVLMDYQKRYMRRVMAVLTRHNNVTVEVMNEAPATQVATKWRKYVHGWLHAEWPALITQSNALGGIAGPDEQMRRWGAEHPGAIDIVATHALWTYDDARREYLANKGVLPGCNECGGDFRDVAKVRRIMWGLTMGGGACWVENIPMDVGTVVTAEIRAFFHPRRDAPAFWRMRPARGLLRPDDPGKYVLATPSGSEILVYLSPDAKIGAFGLAPPGAKATVPCRYRWFRAAGKDSKWGPWRSGDLSHLVPPGRDYGLQVRPAIARAQ